MSVTLKSIAAETGFSITTVSRALAGYDDVNEVTRERIRETAQRLGYRPNQIARQLRSQNSNTLGIIFPAPETGLDDDFFSLLLKGITHAAANQHYDVLVSMHLPDEDEMEAYYRIVGGSRVDGMIVARTYRDDPRIEYLKRIGHPFVVAGRTPPDHTPDFPFIDADSQQGIHLLVTHFAELGHKNIGLILSPEAVAFTPYRLAGYQEGLEATGLPFDRELVVSGDLSRESGEKAAATLLNEHPEISAIIACNDMMAIGAYGAVQSHGLVVGKDIAIGGFDDIPLAAHVSPALTTVRQPIYTIGEQLTTQLVQIISNESPDDLHMLIEPNLVVRESSGFPLSN